MGVSMRDGVRMAADVSKPAACWAASWNWSSVTTKPKRARRSNRPRADQQGKSHRHRGLHQHRRGARVRRSSGSQDPVMNNVATGSLITQQFKDQPENYIFAMPPTTAFRRP
jgi:branched-chain amino acid transport system substrate-binding protein